MPSAARCQRACYTAGNAVRHTIPGLSETRSGKPYMSRLLLVITAAIAFSASAFAQAKTWKIDPNHSAAQFSVRHLGISTVRGAFTKVSGTANYDPADPGTASIEVTIDASSVDTRVEM